MGTQAERDSFLTQVRKGCRIAKKLREIGIRPGGVVRIDSAVDPGTWSSDPDGNSKKIAETFRKACDIADDHGERLAAEGEICWGGMHSWRRMVQLLELVDRPKTLGFQADMAHTFLYLLGYNAPEDRTVTHRLYGGDQELRLMQEAVLGLGGYAAIRLLYPKVTRFHLNEGHTAFAPLAMLQSGASTDEVRAAFHFTTHTPVPAGHDVFPYEMAERCLGSVLPHNIRDLAGHHGLSMTELVELIAGQRPVTDHLAGRLAKCFALPGDWWLDQERRWQASCSSFPDTKPST